MKAGVMGLAQTFSVNGSYCYSENKAAEWNLVPSDPLFASSGDKHISSSHFTAPLPIFTGKEIGEQIRTFQQTFLSSCQVPGTL